MMTVENILAGRRVSRLGVTIFCVSSMFMVGCRATMDISPDKFSEDSRCEVLFEDSQFTDNGPNWASEPPRVDIFDDNCAKVVDSLPNFAPSSEASSFSLDDIGIVENIPDASSSATFSINALELRSPEHCEPRDEYVSDGGDRGAKATVRSDWRIDGLELEDTIAHFDTLSGKVEVVASNRACVYSPRFAATRKVIQVQQNRTNFVPSRAMIVDQVAQHEIRQPFGAIKQPMATVRAVGTKMGNALEEHQMGLTIDDIDMPRERNSALLPYESFDIVTRGVFEVDQQESVIHFANAAHAWSAVSFAQATVLGMVPTESKHITQAGAAVVYEMPDGKARLRLVKLADESEAQSGDVINFTLRFDNVGDQLIGNVTIVDNLTTRLEYIEDSEECTLEAEFSAEESADALALRWEVAEPLEPGNGGVIRFKCRVR